MYSADDPRSTLATSGTAAPTAAALNATAIAAPEVADFSALPPAASSTAGSRIWYLRTQNVLLAYADAVDGECFVRDEESEHLVMLVHEDAAVSVRAGGEEVRLDGLGLVIVPPGPSEVVMRDGGALVRLFEPTIELAEQASNADTYRTPNPRVTITEPWPPPADGERLRAYSVGDLEKSPDRFGRILRSRSFMVNFLFPHQGQRDPEMLSPHHHDDFEQLSLAVSGEFVHHIRTPWETNRLDWQEDVHARVGSPSAVVIPPPTVHTSEAVGPGLNQLIDIFSPPRADFSAKPGWVLNADDYPMPS